jgi:hypothetical protein
LVDHSAGSLTSQAYQKREARLPDHARDGLGTARRTLPSFVTSVIVAASILREVASIVRVPGLFVA